ncbi:MAG: hypothetical protein V4695_02990 [Pseudomonadota bacterium]
MAMNFPKILRSTPAVGNTDANVPTATGATTDSRSVPERTRPTQTTSTTPRAPHNTTSAARPNTATSKLAGFKQLFAHKESASNAHKESLSDWARHSVQGELRSVAATRISTAKNLDDLDHVYQDFDDCDLRGLGLTTLPVRSLLKLPADITVLVDLDKLSPDTVKALTDGVMKKGYDGPTFEPGPKNAMQKETELRAKAAETAREAQNARLRQERAADALPSKPARTGISVASMAGSDGAMRTVQALIEKGFSRTQLKDLHVDIREYVNHGDAHNGVDWFEKKYRGVFDQPISEPGASPKYAKLLTQLLKV